MIAHLTPAEIRCLVESLAYETYTQFAERLGLSETKRKLAVFLDRNSGS